jgi:hypothetical protein
LQSFRSARWNGRHSRCSAANMERESCTDNHHDSLLLGMSSQEQVKNPTSMLSSWYQAVLQMVSNYLSTTFDEPSPISQIHVLNSRTKYGTSANRWALERKRRVLREAHRDTTLYHTGPDAPSHWVSLLRHSMSFYVYLRCALLVTYLAFHSYLETGAAHFLCLRHRWPMLDSEPFLDRGYSRRPG